MTVKCKGNCVVRDLTDAEQTDDLAECILNATSPQNIYLSLQSNVRLTMREQDQDVSLEPLWLRAWLKAPWWDECCAGPWDLNWWPSFSFHGQLCLHMREEGAGDWWEVFPVSMVILRSFWLGDCHRLSWEFMAMGPASDGEKRLLNIERESAVETGRGIPCRWGIVSSAVRKMDG